MRKWLLLAEMQTLRATLKLILSLLLELRLVLNTLLSLLLLVLLGMCENLQSLGYSQMVVVP
jgi:hypothetical protein